MLPHPHRRCCCSHWLQSKMIIALLFPAVSIDTSPLQNWCPLALLESGNYAAEKSWNKTPVACIGPWPMDRPHVWHFHFSPFLLLLPLFCQSQHTFKVKQERNSIHENYYRTRHRNSRNMKTALKKKKTLWNFAICRAREFINVTQYSIVTGSSFPRFLADFSQFN